MRARGDFAIGIKSAQEPDQKWRLQLYQRPVRYGLVALGLLLTAPVAALILLTLAGHAVHIP